MNPPFHKLRQAVRAVIISKVWYDRNQLAHHKPSLILDVSQVIGFIQEACHLAKGKKSTRPQASLMLKKLKKL